MTFATAADLLRPRARGQALAYDAALVLGSSVLLTLSARIAIPLPFSPVPITAQTMTVLLLGAILGSRRGSLCVAAYLLQGALGLPVFAGGTAGLAVLGGPRAGYLLGFVAAAFTTGALAERGWDRRMGSTLAAMLLGNAAIYAFGLPWLAAFVGPRNAIPLGLVPFIPGDLLKVGLAALGLPSGWRALSLRNHRR
jgi:biotin transport system substrate-specific component